MDTETLIEWVGGIVIIIVGLAIAGAAVGGAYYLVIYLNEEIIPATRGFWITALAVLSVAVVIASVVWIFISATQWIDKKNLRSNEHRLIEEAQAKQMEEQRLVWQAKAAKAESLRMAEEVQAKAQEEKRRTAEIEKEAAETERLLKEAEAKNAELELAIRQAEAEKARAAEERAGQERAKAEAEAQAARDALAKAEAVERAAEAELKKAEAERAAAEARRAIAQAEARKKEEERKALEEKAKIAAARQAEQEARLNADEIERQNRLNDYPLPLLVDAFLTRADVLSGEWIDNGHRENKAFMLYEALKIALQKARRVPLERREDVTKAMMIANQVDTILDLYAEKIEQSRKNRKMSEEQREKKAQALEEARDRYIEKLLSS